MDRVAETLHYVRKHAPRVAFLLLRRNIPCYTCALTGSYRKGSNSAWRITVEIYRTGHFANRCVHRFARFASSVVVQIGAHPRHSVTIKPHA